MKVVYVAGPFRGPTQWDVAQNIRRAEEVGLLVAESGAMPLIPHANTAHFHGQLDEEFWIEGTKEFLRRCDGVVLLHGWRKSQGSVGEYRLAGALGIPRLPLDVYYDYQWREELLDFVDWLGRHDGKDYKPEKHGAAPAPTENGLGPAPGELAARYHSGG